MNQRPTLAGLNPRTRRGLATALTGVALVASTALIACGAGPRPTATAVPAAAAQGTAVPAGARATTAAAGKRYAAAPPMTIDQNKRYIATIKTNQGDIRAELNAKDAPLTVNNFVFLARDGFYNGVIFHRVIKGFMIQGGDPTGTGMGDPGYRFADEPVKGKYEIGSLAMANSGANTNGSQFFICQGTNCTTLQPKYNLFGKVVEGQDVVNKIADIPTTPQDRPTQDVRITTIEIAEQ